MLNTLKYYMFCVRISLEACVVKMFHVKRLSLEVITFTNLVSRETLCLRRVGFNLTPFPSEAQLIDFQVIQRV